MTNVKGHEFQHRNQQLEYLRAGTTDDVECFFSLIRDNLGRDFILKRVQYEWRKLCIEFSKRIDPSLLTLAHTIDSEGPDLIFR